MEIPSITKNETLGLEAVTIFNEKPYFFLFSDIDSKDKDELLKVLKFYEKWHYSCYYYETTKGFHIVSPVLLTFRTWLFRIESLKKKVPEISWVKSNKLLIHFILFQSLLKNVKRHNYDKYY